MTLQEKQARAQLADLIASGYVPKLHRKGTPTQDMPLFQPNNQLDIEGRTESQNSNSKTNFQPTFKHSNNERQ